MNGDNKNLYENHQRFLEETEKEILYQQNLKFDAEMRMKLAEDRADQLKARMERMEAQD